MYSAEPEGHGYRATSRETPTSSPGAGADELFTATYRGAVREGAEGPEAPEGAE